MESPPAALLFGDHECDREFAVRCSLANRTHMSLASQHAATVGGSGLLGNGKALPPHYGIQRNLGLEGHLASRNDEGKGENRLRWYPAVSSYQLRAGHPRLRSAVRQAGYGSWGKFIRRAERSLLLASVAFCCRRGITSTGARRSVRLWVYDIRIRN
jgi:hypothetical protein